MFSTKIRGGKAFAAEQKIRELKKNLLKSKRLHKTTSTKRFDPKKTIEKTVDDDMSAGQRDVTEVQCSRTGG